MVLFSIQETFLILIINRINYYNLNSFTKTYQNKNEKLLCFILFLYSHLSSRTSKDIMIYWNKNTNEGTFQALSEKLFNIIFRKLYERSFCFYIMT